MTISPEWVGLIGVVVGALLGGPVTYATARFQQRRDRREAKDATASGLMVDLAWSVSRLPKLRNQRFNVRLPILTFPTPVLDTFHERMHLFRAATVESIRSYAVMLEDIRELQRFLDSRHGTLEAGDDVYLELTGRASQAIVVGGGAIAHLVDDEGARLPSFLEQEDLNAILRWGAEWHRLHGGGSDQPTDPSSVG